MLTELAAVPAMLENSTRTNDAPPRDGVAAVKESESATARLLQIQTNFRRYVEASGETQARYSAGVEIFVHWPIANTGDSPHGKIPAEDAVQNPKAPRW